jgi:flagellar hook assembly protein FlgD
MVFADVPNWPNVPLETREMVTQTPQLRGVEILARVNTTPTSTHRWEDCVLECHQTVPVRVKNERNAVIDLEFAKDRRQVM